MHIWSSSRVVVYNLLIAQADGHATIMRMEAIYTPHPLHRVLTYSLAEQCSRVGGGSHSIDIKRKFRLQKYAYEKVKNDANSYNGVNLAYCTDP